MHNLLDAPDCALTGSSDTLSMPEHDYYAAPLKPRAGMRWDGYFEVSDWADSLPWDSAGTGSARAVSLPW